MSELNSEEQQRLTVSEEFPAVVKNARDSAVDALRVGQNLDAILEATPVPVYVKNSEGQVLASNALNNSLFGRNGICVGRFVEDFLDTSLKPISQHTDSLILSGCSICDCLHEGIDLDGRTVVFRTVKVSMIGAGDSQFTLLGSTSIAEIKAAAVSPVLTLQQSWEQFRKFDARDKDIAKMLSFGKSPKEIGEQLSCSKKTVELRRSAILSCFGLDNSNQLTKLLVRLHDHGFCDFGH